MYTSKVSASPKIYTKKYYDFAGVDFSSAITEVADNRSPDALNMIADFGGFPQKRTGWKTIISDLAGRVNGIFQYVGKTYRKIIVHAGDTLYDVTSGEATVIFSGLANDKSSAFVWEGKLYILDGEHYLVYDGTTASEVVGYVPTTVIAATPTGGGESFEPINLISPQRINLITGTAGTTQFQLDAVDLTSVDKIELLNSSGEWAETTNYTADLAAGTITFTAAPGVSPITGEDNVRVTFTKRITANENRIRKCKIYSFFGVGNDNRIFVTGNDEYRNYDWCSESNDPTYFPDINYSIIGSDNSAIMGYLKQYSDQVIIKESNDQDATLYLRSVSENNDGDVIFPVLQGLAGVGAVSKHCFGNLLDDNLFLAAEGVFGLDTSSVTLQKTTQNRSMYVNAKLTREQNLSEAYSTTWNGYYCVFINNKVYLADSKRRSSNQSSSFGYEWHYWDNVPARVAADIDGKLYFGTTDGRLCIFKTEAEDLMGAYSDDGAPIQAYWTTKLDDLNDVSSYKKIEKRNIGVLAMPFAKSSANIFYLKDEFEPIKEFELGSVFDFNYIDFDKLTFGIAEVPVFIPTNKKQKKVKMFRMKIENNKVDEAFGLYQICLNYSINNAIKR